MEKGSDFVDVKAELRVMFKEGGYLLTAVNNGGVISVAEESANLLEGLMGVLAEKEHSDVAGSA